MSLDKLLEIMYWEIKDYSEDPTEDRLKKLLWEAHNHGYVDGLYADD